MLNVPPNINISPSRTYMVGIRSSVNPSQTRFEEVIVPERSPNTIRSAKQNFLLGHLEEIETIQILICVSNEDYSINSPITEQKEDIETALNMLYVWNEKQKNPALTYSMALTNLLRQVALMDDFTDKFTRLKETALLLLQME